MEGNVLILNYQTTPSPQTMESTKVTTAHVEFKHTGASSDYQLKTIHPERVLMTSSGSHNKDLNGSDKVDRLKMINDQQLSVLDLLGDDGPNRNLEGSLGHESHVAFSVEGLGKVGAETPVHSPQQPSRYFPYGCSSPSKVTRRALSFKKFNSRLDDLAPEVDSFREYNDIPFYESELPFYSRGSVDYFSYPKQKKSVGKGFLQFNDNGPNLKTFLANEDIFFNSEDENEYMWTESSSLPDDDFLDESKCCMSWKNWPCQMDSNSAEHSNFENHVKKDITFEGLNVQNSRVCTKATSRFNVLESSAPYSYHQISENHHDFTTPDGICVRYPMFARTSGVKPVISQPAWSCFAAKDAKESLSLLSEESCSSSAVWDEAIEDPPSNSVGKKMKTYGSDGRTPTSKGGVKNIYTQETHCTKQDNLQLRENVYGSGKCVRMSSPTPKTKFQKIIGPDKSWLFEDGDTTHNINSGFGSFFRNSAAKESQPSGSQLSNEDLFNVYTVPKLHVDAKLSSERSKSDIPEHFPCGSNFSEKLALCEHFNHMHSSETPFLLEIRSRPGNPKLSPVFDKRCNPHDPFKDLGCQADTEFPGITEKESGCIDGEKEAGIPQASSGKIELQEDVCDGSNCLSSENRMTGDASDAGDSCSHQIMEAKDSTPEMMESLKATFSPEHVEEISSVDGLEAPDKTEGGLHGKEYQNNIQTHLCGNGCKEIEDSWPKERNMEGKKQYNSADPSCQVMMLESYVLQLLCVHVLKEASTRGTEKKEH